MHIFLPMLVCWAGCVQPYQPTKPQPNVVEQVTPSAAFKQYQKDVADNFRVLATNCLEGKYEYVSELIDDAVALDKVSKKKRSQPIDQLVSEAIGADLLDPAEAAKVLTKIADDLDPAGKVVTP
jgi:hypothetical protein